MLNKGWENLQDQIIIRRDQICVISENSELFRLLIAGEDHRVKYHNGVDFIALVRALWKTLFLKQREGGSTIAMQLVRVLTGKYERTFSRKTQEIFLAYKLTKHISQKEILSLYLSIAYFGWNMHGIKQACKSLRLDLNGLNMEDSASLIARLKYPEPKQSSEERSKQIDKRSKYILKRYHTLKIKETYEAI